MEHQKVDESGKKKVRSANWKCVQSHLRIKSCLLMFGVFQMKEALVRERRVTFEDALESRLASVNLDDSDEVLKVSPMWTL